MRQGQEKALAFTLLEPQNYSIFLKFQQPTFVIPSLHEFYTNFQPALLLSLPPSYN